MAALLLLIAVIGTLDWWCTRRMMATGEDRVLAAATDQAAIIATEMRDLLSDVDSLQNQAELSVQLAEMGSTQAATLTTTLLVRSMQGIRLKIDGLEVRDRNGAMLLDVGDRLDPPAPDSTEPIDLSAWHRTQYDRSVVIYTRVLPGPEHHVARAAFDQQRLSAVLMAGLPAESGIGDRPAALLVRLSDRRVILRTGEAVPASPDGDQRISLAGQAAMRRREHGRLHLISAITGLDTLVGFETLPGFNLAVSVGAPVSRSLAPVIDDMHVVDLVALVVVLAGVVATALLIVWLRRRRSRAAREALAGHHAAEAALRHRLDRLTAGSPALLFLARIDADGTYHRLFMTRNALTVIGWPDEEVATPEQFWGHMAEEDRHLRDVNHARAMRLGRSTVEYRFIQPDGRIVWLRNEAVRISQFDDGSGEIAGAVTNITREREIAAIAAVQSRMATLGELATGLAHELTQPITVIGIAAELVEEMAQEDHCRPEILQQLKSMIAQTSRANDIITHLRHYGHAEGGALGPVDLRRAVEGALTLANAQLRRASVQVTVCLPGRLPPARGRSVQVEQVLVNLFLNAKDAMMNRPEDQRRITVTATHAGEASEPIQLHFADSGTGIPDHVMPHLFDAFFTTKRPGEGTGLGLSISKSLMEGVGGSIAANSTAEGATFTLTFQRM